MINHTPKGSNLELVANHLGLVKKQNESDVDRSEKLAKGFRQLFEYHFGSRNVKSVEKCS